MTAFEALQQELHQITLELGQAFIDHRPKPDLANDARAIKSILELAHRRPAVRTALGITMSDLMPVPALTSTTTPTPKATETAPLITVPEQAAPAAESEEDPREAAKRRDRDRKAYVYPKLVAGRQARIQELVALALDPSAPDLSVEPEGETEARRRERLAALRAWGVSAGLKVSAMGPVQVQVLDAYRLARQLASKPRVARSAEGQSAVIGGRLKTKSLAQRQEHAYAGYCRHPHKVAFANPTEARLAAEQNQREHVAENPADAAAALVEYGVYLCSGSSHYHFGKKNPNDRDPSIPVEDEASHNLAIARRRVGNVHVVSSSSAVVTA